MILESLAELGLLIWIIGLVARKKTWRPTVLLIGSALMAIFVFYNIVDSAIEAFMAGWNGE